MTFEIKRESQTRQVPVSLVEESKQSDTFTSKKDPFSRDPANDPEDLGMDFLVPGQAEQAESESEEDSEGTEGSEDSEFPQGGYNDNPNDKPDGKSYEEVQKEKALYLSKLRRLDSKIEGVRRFSMEHSLNDIKGEYFRIKKELNVDTGIDFCRQGLIFCVSAIEMANGNYKLGGNLGGWSQAIHSDIESYDDVFEELYEKYYGEMNMAPELKLIAMLAGSAFMFHMQKSMYDTEGSVPRRQRPMNGPSMDQEDILRDLDEYSDISEESVSTQESDIKIKIKEAPATKVPKKRGRPKKN